MPQYDALRVSLDNGATWHILTDVLITTSSDWLRTSHITITATGSVVAAAWPVPASMDETTLRAGMDAASMTVPFYTHTFYPQHDALLRMIGTSLADERVSVPLVPLSRPEDYRAAFERGYAPAAATEHVFHQLPVLGPRLRFGMSPANPVGQEATLTCLDEETTPEDQDTWRANIRAMITTIRDGAASFWRSPQPFQEVAQREATLAAQTARGRDLLQTILTENQWSCFERYGYVEVWGKQIPRGARRPRRYRLFNSLYDQTIAMINGVWCEQYCLAPNSYITNEDALAARVLLLRNDERTFRRTANRSIYRDHTSTR